MRGLLRSTQDLRRFEPSRDGARRREAAARRAGLV
jgi:hypothetical protein